jgi:Fe-S-cluster-containing dehydrogenase component/formate-dependent nitrite reductase membrane component NrfD
MNLGFAIDTRSCIGCHACSTACKSENEVPLGVYRTWVKTVESGTFPDTRRAFQVTRCNHCANAPCVRICPTKAMHRRPDGIIDFDSDACIGCKACIQACPYDAIHLDPETHTAAKCNFCAHRIDVGLEPACVVVCPAHAILAGDLDDPASEISRTLARRDASVRKPEQGTAPKLFYLDGTDITMHPTAAPHGVSYAMADQRGDVSVPRGPTEQGLPGTGPVFPGRRQAADLLRVSYDVHHGVYWHWPIAAYLVTKHVAGGVMALLGLAALGVLPWSAGLFAAAAPVAFGCLLVTFALLVYDLDRPDRFFYLFVRPQWQSWVARAAWLLSAFAFASFGWLVAELGWQVPGALRGVFGAVNLVLGVASVVYTGFLFAQAEGRDLWQSPHTPVLLAFQSAAVSALLLAALGGGSAYLGVFAVSALFALLTTVLADRVVPMASEVARLAARDLTDGRYATHWRAGLVLGYVAPAVLALVHPALALPVALAGIGSWAYGWLHAPQHVRNS